MASGLECRVPFLDARVIAASECTQSEWNVRFRRTKALLKEVYLPVLPSHLSSLSKACFYPPLAKWFRRECAVLVHETLEHERIKEFFEVDAVRKVFEDHQSGKCYGLHTLSTLTQLRCWFEAVYDA